MSAPKADYVGLRSAAKNARLLMSDEQAQKWLDQAAKDPAWVAKIRERQRQMVGEFPDLGLVLDPK